MIPTAEVRWFAEGALPEAAKVWLDGLAPGTPPEPRRTDRYVRTAAEDLGVKVRQGRFEVKRRSGALGSERLAAGVTGRVETWQKWSFELAADDVRPADWIGVEKRRWLVKFRVKGGDVAPAAWVGAHANGVNVELATVEAAGRRWWSVCLESFGPGEAARLEALRAVAAHVFGAAPPALTAGRSMGYPAWLAREA